MAQENFRENVRCFVIAFYGTKCWVGERRGFCVNLDERFLGAVAVVGMSEKFFLAGTDWRGFAEVEIGSRSGHPAAGGTFDKTDLHQIGFDNFLKGADVFRKSGGKGFQANRAAIVFVN